MSDRPWLEVKGKRPRRHIARGRRDVLERISGLDQQPFREELARWLGCSPDEGVLREWARAEPGKWATALSFLGKLAGFHEKQMQIHEASITVNVQAMSDVEIEMRLKKLAKEVLGDEKIAGGDVIDGELVESGTGDRAGGSDDSDDAGGAEGMS